MSTPRVPSEYPASSGEDGPCSDCRSNTVSEAPGTARARTTPPARTIAVRPCVPSEYSPTLLREGFVPLSAPPCRAVPWYVRIRSVRVVLPSVRAPRKCRLCRRARPVAARVRACDSLVTFRVIRTRTMEGVCALRHGWSTFRRAGTKRARVQHPLEYPCPVPSRTRTHVATACCAGVSAWHGPVHSHFTAQRDEPCTPQGFLLELAGRHDPCRAVGAQAAYRSVRPPRARCRAVRLRASACPLVSVSTPACARTHRRTAVRVPYPRVAVSTLAAAPAVAQRRGVLGIVGSTPSRARALCVPVASAPHGPFHFPAQIVPRTGR
jgi:hypothetical protein